MGRGRRRARMDRELKRLRRRLWEIQMARLQAEIDKVLYERQRLQVGVV